MDEMNPWFRHAIEDYETIKLLAGKNLVRVLLFHVQQFFEKTLKGILDDKRVNTPKTHDLVKLAKDAGINLKDFDIQYDDLQFLTSIFIETRYPSDLGLLPDGEPTTKDEEYALDLAGKLYKFYTARAES